MNTKSKHEEMKNEHPTLEEVKQKSFDIFTSKGKQGLMEYIGDDLDFDLFNLLDGYDTEEKTDILIELFDKQKPKQYQIGIDTFKRAEENMSLEERMACVKWNIDKYTWRDKGQDIEDLRKIIAYAEWGIKQLENN